jgi:hypothetical protein
MDIVNCYIDDKLLIRGHGYRVIVSLCYGLSSSRCATLSALLFLLLVVVKPVQLERNQFASDLARVLALLVTVQRKSHLERAKFIRSSVGASSAAP